MSLRRVPNNLEDRVIRWLVVFFILIVLVKIVRKTCPLNRISSRLSEYTLTSLLDLSIDST